MFRTEGRSFYRIATPQKYDRSFPVWDERVIVDVGESVISGCVDGKVRSLESE